VAYLIIAIYPILTRNPVDNSSYLQAFRHFYALAVKRANFDTIDIMSNRFVGRDEFEWLKSGDLILNTSNNECCPELRYVKPKHPVSDRLQHSIEKSFDGPLTFCERSASDYFYDKYAFSSCRVSH